MTAVDYPGTDTPDVTFSYTRLGRQNQITDGVGTRTFNYDDGDQQGEANMLHLIYEHIVGTNGFYTRAITRHYQGTGTGEVPGRDGGFHIGSELAPEYEVNYSYNDKTGPGLTLTGRFDRITGTGLPAYGVLYHYEPSSDLIAYTYFDTVGDELSAPAIAERWYEENRDLVYRVTNVVEQDELSRYTYVNDALGRRKGVTTGGGAFGSQAFNSWGYNAKSELESSRRYTGVYTSTPPPETEIPAQKRLYEYDQIGNREQSTTGTGAAQYYCATDLNQYSATDDADTCTSPFTESFAYDDDGNLTLDRQFVYTWDAENRLIRVETRIDWGQNSGAYDADDKRVYFSYDYMGRRVRKRVETYNGSSWPETSDELFVYDGWNVVMVIDANASDVNATSAILRKYTWGLDLSGTIHGAGGIGGLLACVETQGEHEGAYWYFYDANGNVGQLVKTIKDGEGNITGVESTLAARYEYDPYGNPIPIPQPPGPGPYADLNPFRFSTKWFDAETGLYYYGYRCYSPRLGRWISRDPIGEKGGLNLYEYVLNTPLNLTDPRGLHMVAPGGALVCCRYRKTTFSWWSGGSGGGGARFSDIKCEKTERCSGPAMDPRGCCECAGRRIRGTPSSGWGESTTMTLLGATWGSCNCCTIYTVRTAGESWPNHLGILLVCGDSGTKIDFAYKDIYWGITVGQYVDVTEDLNLRVAFATYTVVEQMKITKASADAIVATAKADVANPPDYNAVQDCHWYVRLLLALGEPCDDTTR